MSFSSSSSRSESRISSTNKRQIELRTQSRKWFAIVLATAILAGCAATPAPLVSQEVLSKSSPPELKRKVIADRAEARWQALIGSDLDRAYTFMSPASRDSTSLDAYKAKIKPGMWRDAKVDAVDCDGEACTVKLMITYDHPMMKGVKTPLSESWIIDQGKAWYVFRG